MLALNRYSFENSLENSLQNSLENSLENSLQMILEKYMKYLKEDFHLKRSIDQFSHDVELNLEELT